MATTAPVLRGLPTGASQDLIASTRARNEAAMAAAAKAEAAAAAADREASLRAAASTYGAGNVRTEERTNPATGEKVTIVTTSSDGGKSWDVYTQDGATKDYQSDVDNTPGGRAVTATKGPTGGTSFRNIAADAKDLADSTNLVGDPGGIGKMTNTDTTGDAIRNNTAKVYGYDLDLTSVFRDGMAPGNGAGGAGGSVDLSTLSQTVADANRLRDQYNVPTTTNAPPQAQAQLIAQIERAQQQAELQAQQVQAAQIAAYQAAVGPGAVQYGTATAGQAAAARIQQTAMAQQQAAIQAERVQAALVAQQPAIAAERVRAAQADRTVLAPTELAGRTTIDPVALSSFTDLAPVALSEKERIDAALQAQFRSKQEGLVAGLQGAIEGRDPSVAEILLRQATERNQANQFAQAQAASGMNTGLAQRQAMINAADINQQSIGQQALLRAQEIATARGQLGGVLDQGRGADITMATTQAQLNQGVNLANTQARNTGALAQLDADVKTKLTNAGFINTQHMTQAQLDQAVQLANAGFKNNATTTQAQLDAAQKALNVTQQNTVAAANADRTLEAAKVNVTLAQQAALANQSAENQARLANAQNALEAAKTNAALAQQVALANQAALNETYQMNATMQNQANIANAGYQTQASVATANNQTSANQTSATLAAQIAQSNARNQLDWSTSQAKLNQDAATGNADRNLSAGTTNRTLAQQVALANQTAENNRYTTNANNQTNVNQSNNTANISQQQIDALAKQNAASNTLDAQRIAQQAAAAAATAAATSRQQDAADQKRNQDLLIELGKAYAKSDRRAKTNVSSADSEIASLLGSLKEYQFDYKDPTSPGAAEGRRFGVMAQDLEKSRAGRSLVRDTPEGKMVDVNQAVLAALAGLGNVNRRIAKIEKEERA